MPRNRASGCQRTVTEAPSDHPPSAAAAVLKEVMHELRAVKSGTEQPPVIQIFLAVVMVDGSMHTTNTVNVSHSQIANLAVDAQQTIGRIDQAIGALRHDADGKALAEALQTLTRAVTENTEIASDETRAELLDGIEALLVQAQHPPARRKRGVFRPLIDSIATACDAAGGLATAWQVAGPAIRGYFGL